MKATKLNGRTVEITDIQFGFDICDSFITTAYYDDTDDELSDADLEALTEQEQELIYEEWVQYKVGQAEDRAGEDR